MATSIISWVGTIFHVGMTEQRFFNILTTKGWGFISSAIWRRKKKIQTENKKEKEANGSLIEIMREGRERNCTENDRKKRVVEMGPCTWGPLELLHPNILAFCGARGEQQPLPWTLQTKISTSSCSPYFLKSNKLFLKKFKYKHLLVVRDHCKYAWCVMSACDKFSL